MQIKCLGRKNDNTCIQYDYADTLHVKKSLRVRVLDNNIMPNAHVAISNKIYLLA